MASFITVDRKILKWEWYQDVKVFHLFLYFLLKANWEDGSWKGIPVKRGQLITGRLQLSKDTGLSEREIRTCQDKLKKTGEIAVKSTSKYSIITICKYSTYQNKFDNIDQQKVQSQTNKRPTNDQQSDQQTTTNNNIIINNKNKQGFITFPLPEHFNGLKEIQIGSIIQLIKITKQVSVTSNDVIGLWEVFKVQNLTGKKYYANEEDVYSHFTNWAKDKRFDVNKAIVKINSEKLPDANEVAKKYL